MNEIRFYPVINFITGPPGILRNGGIWRWIKKEFVNNEIPQFMTQVLHFVDFPVTKKTFDKWFSNGETLKDWIKKEKNEYNPKIFTDSGGFKLLYNKEYELSEFGIEPTQDKIFQLQLKYGADFVASLDYPIPPNLSKEEAEERMEKSIKNCIKLMQLIYDDYINSKDVFPYLAIHGRHAFEVKLYIEKLFNELEENGFYDESFGLALGSLVPVKNHYELLVEVAHAVKETLQEYDKKIDIHIFGISGYVIPFLAYLGVNSFDSNTYIQAAQNLRFLTPNFLQKDFYEISEEDLNLCGCKYCQYILNGGISTAKKLLRKKGNRTYKFNGDPITKSTIYAFIAMHNLNVQLNLINVLNKLKNRESIGEWLINYSKGRRKALSLIAKISRIDETLHNIIIDDNIISSHKTLHEFYSISTRRKIRLNLTPDAFNVSNMHDYSPEGKKVMLILPCTASKPYSKSRTHRRIINFLEKNNIPVSEIEIVTLSGMFGPVPRKYEDYPAVLEYEYVLSTKAKNRIDLIVSRLLQFLEDFGNKFDFILAYIASKAYREVIDSTNKKSKFNILLLPKKPRRSVSSELHKRENLEELLKVIKKFFKSNEI